MTEIPKARYIEAGQDENTALYWLSKMGAFVLDGDPFIFQFPDDPDSLCCKVLGDAMEPTLRARTYIKIQPLPRK